MIQKRSYTFERIATAAKWPLDQWTLILMPYLTGLVQEVVDMLEPEEIQDYPKVKTAILGTLDLLEELVVTKQLITTLPTNIRSWVLRN